MRERDVEKALVTEVRQCGGRAYKWVSPGNAGVPDRIVIFPGRAALFVEVKTERGTLSAVQKVQIPRLREMGQKVYVVKGLSGVADFFEKEGGTLEQFKERVQNTEGILAPWAYLNSRHSREYAHDRCLRICLYCYHRIQPQHLKTLSLVS